jgi:hypothetical protein
MQETTFGHARKYARKPGTYANAKVFYFLHPRREATVISGPVTDIICLTGNC